MAPEAQNSLVGLYVPSGWGTYGIPCSACCRLNPALNKQTRMDGWMAIHEMLVTEKNADFKWYQKRIGWNALKVPYYEKHIFSGVYMYKLVLPELTPRMRKTNESCIMSAVHPLVKQLFRFSSCGYATKGEMFVGWPPLRDNRRYLRGKLAVFRNAVAQS